MSWFLIALLAPFLLACANHNDKFLLSRYLTEKSVGSFLIPSSLLGGVTVPIVSFIEPHAYDISLAQGAALVSIGMSGVLATGCYLHALDIDGASFVVPFYRMVPTFALVLGYFILGETRIIQGFGSFFTVIGALELSFELGRQRVRFFS